MNVKLDAGWITSLVAVSLLMSACTDQRFNDETIAFPPVHPVATPSVRIFTSSDQPVMGPHAYIVLVQNQPHRNVAICQAVKANLDTDHVGDGAGSAIPVYWFDKRPASSAKLNGFECQDRVTNFDFIDSDKILAELLVANPNLDEVSAGPILVAFRDAHTLAYALDLSRVPEDGLSEIFLKWHNQMLRPSKNWDATTFTEVKLRQRLRMILQKAADVVVLLMPQLNSPKRS